MEHSGFCTYCGLDFLVLLGRPRYPSASYKFKKGIIVKANCGSILTPKGVRKIMNMSFRPLALFGALYRHYLQDHFKVGLEPTWGGM